ncbi:MAG TPA: LLM class F420-dependent oxidoreductase [Candidatus Binataceae bacterium]|nr:LLM class F420-dependent oxidoreductase [Candidatus Binataceae bacterium]
MRLGLVSGYSGPRMAETMEVILEAERLGYDSVWTGEAWGSDVVSFLAFVGARTSKIKLGAGILQMQARTPAMTAMTAMTLDGLTNGRFLIGMGPSNPQVIEGWHGVPYGKPLQRYREYIEIIRMILRREQPLSYDGREYQIPYRGPGASGLGKPLKSILHGRPDMKIYTASISPKGIELAAELADGILPVWMSPDWYDALYKEHLEAGFAKAGPHKKRAEFDFSPYVTCVMGNDIAKCREPVKASLALYIGGMGARNKNFYNSYVRNFGYEDLATRLQDLYLGGKKNEAQAAVPDELVDAVALVGPKEHIRDQLARWKASPVTTMLIGTNQVEALRTLAELCL